MYNEILVSNYMLRKKITPYMNAFSYLQHAILSCKYGGQHKKKIDMKILLRHIKCIVNITMDECSNVIYRGTGNVNIFPSNINDKIRENLPI